MSVYDRAARKFTFQLSVGTSTDLGPGSYDHRGGITGKSEGYAPFQSLANRDFVLSLDDAADMPGPTQYYPKPRAHKILGCTSASNRDSRFKPLISLNPGPGQYCIEEKIKCHSAQRKKTDVKDKLNNRFKVAVSTASIPHSKSAYGYEEGQFGSLQKQIAPKNDTSGGPAFYYPELTEGCTTNRYKGCFWSYDKGPRTYFGGAPGPGPDQYEPYSDHWVDLVDYCRSRDNAKLPQLKVPRFFDKLQQQAIREHIPGPASYNYSGKFDCHMALYREDGTKIKHPPFMKQAKRFVTFISDLPGPGQYDDPRTALGALTKITGMTQSPFGHNASRFVDKCSDNMPGPQAYDVSNVGKSTPGQSYITRTRKGGFGTTSIRNPDPSDKDNIPGPTYYQPRRSDPINLFNEPPSSMFSSTTNRYYDPIVAERSRRPDGTSYDVITAYHLSQDRRPHAAPRTADDKKRHNSFLFSASRYAKGSPLDCPDPSLPGPASYEHRSFLNTRSGNLFYRDKRFNTVTEETPGPGQYEILPAGSRCTEKCDFNVSLGASCLTNRRSNLLKRFVPKLGLLQ